MKKLMQSVTGWVRTHKIISCAAGALLLAVILLLCLLTPSDKPAYGENILLNGDFSHLDDLGRLEDWVQDAWIRQGATNYRVETQEGNTAVIVNYAANDARYAQRVSVLPDTYYCLSGEISASEAYGWGANLSIEGLYVYSDGVYDSDGGFEYVELYGKTGPRQTSVTVYARLGGYSNECTGEARFRNLSLRAVENVPGEVFCLSWDSADYSYAEEEASGTGAGMILVSAFLYLLLFVCLYRKVRLSDPMNGGKASIALPAVLILLALTLRLVLAGCVPGYDVDIGCFTGWAENMAYFGPGAFYRNGFCDYPPGYMVVLWVLGLIGQSTGTGVTEFMVKLPPVFCDCLVCLMLYRTAARKLSDRHALAVLILYAFNPFMIEVSACWGQADSVMTLLLLLTVLLVLDDRWMIALPVYVTAVLFKPQALLFGPLGLAAFVNWIIRGIRTDRKKTLNRALGALGLSLAAGLVFILPFTGQQSPDWIITLYGKTMSEYPYVTVNACNLFFLLGKNWLGTACVPEWYTVLLVLLSAGIPLAAGEISFAGIKRFSVLKNARHAILTGMFALLCVSVLGCMAAGVLNYSLLGTLMIVYTVLLCAYFLYVSGDIKKLPFIAAVMLLMLFSFGTMMHERYLYPAIALLLLAYALCRDRRILILTVTVSLAAFLNVAPALDRNIRIGGAAGHLNAPLCGIESDTAFLEYLSAFLICVSGIYGTWIATRIMRRDAEILEAVQSGNAVSSASVRNGSRASADPDGLTRRKRPDFENDPPRALTWRDGCLMLAVTAVYTVLTLTNLGSVKAPQTFWMSDDPKEQVVFDLGESREFQMLYYGGIHHTESNFDVEVSEDGEEWSRFYECGMEEGDCFKWQAVSYNAGSDYPVTLHGRYARLTANHYNLTIFEVIFRDALTGEEIPCVGAVSGTENPMTGNLIDEPGTCEGNPGHWYNSTYFDEIYHARTAYEQLHGMIPYETTHPPLGKVLMEIGILLFGMTPFGWRFMGAMVGALMLPGMYLLGHLLIRRKWGGPAAMLLMAFDLMHFTQTRIATIDSYVVLFIIWSVVFMIYWFKMDFFGKPFWKTLVPLGLSGLFMGLSVASKWTGCYNGVGLALIFFRGLYRRFVQNRGIRPAGKQTGARGTMPDSQKRLIYTLLSCLIFFVAVPVLIYYLSYIPYFRYAGGVTVDGIVSAAEGMLSYHSIPGLGMDHPFYSPWYEWPLIIKPMWYYSDSIRNYTTASTIASMGNPAVWWIGLIGLAALLCLKIRDHVVTRPGIGLSLYTERDETSAGIVLVAFAAQFIPWTLVPRGTYIYHYFASVPFIILCTLLCLERLSEKRNKLAGIVLAVWIAAAAVLFIAFFPYASGLEVNTGWLNAMKWFDGWIYY